jgi:hypothetical protein
MYLTLVNATPVYELLGKKGIVMNDAKPQINVGYIEGNLAYRIHDGGHTDTPDWPAFFEFASKFIDATRLSVSSDAITISADGNNRAVFEIQSNKNWKIQSDADWLTLDKKSGSGNEAVKISASKNTTGSGRSAKLGIESDGRKLVVLVTQPSENGKIEVSKNELTFPGDGGTSGSFEIASETAWNVSGSADWIIADPEAGVNNRQIKVTALPNPLVAQRSAVLIVSSPSENKSIKVIQHEGKPTLRVFAESVRVKADASNNSSVFVAVNTSCTVESPFDWVSGSIRTQGTFTRLVIQVKENTTGKPRSAKIAIKVKDLEPAFVEVIQEGK